MPLHRPTGPISLLGQSAVIPDAELPITRLKVEQRPEGNWGQSAGVHSSSLTAMIPGYSGEAVFFELADGSDCILQVRSDPEVAPGCIQVDAIIQHNLHLALAEAYNFRLFLPPTDEPFELTDLDGEVRLLHSCDPRDAAVEVDATALSSAFAKLCFGRVLAMNELVGVAVGGVQLLVRITAVNTVPEEEREEMVGYHCYRGLLTPQTALFFTAIDGLAPIEAPQHTGTPAEVSAQPHSSQNGGCATAGHSSTTAENGNDATAVHGSTTASSAPTDQDNASSSNYGSTAHASAAVQTDMSSMKGSLPAAANKTLPSTVAGLGAVRLVNARSRAARPPPTNIVHVTTNDGEWFPVKKRLLRPCINLTKYVRSEEAVAGRCEVDVDTLTFDRVLIFLEAHALGRPPPQHWALHLLDDLLTASKTLGLRSLQDYCEERLGSASARIGTYTFDQVRAANAADGCWLVLDGMVLDVGRWLPEHPGGSTIIPGQALNLDCARFFEIYHASRESFLYLKDFYIGELLPEERALVPVSEEPPSDDFLQQLRDFTSFRIDPSPKTFKSF